MSAYYNPSIIEGIKDQQLVIDTNILNSCFTNENYFTIFISVFENNPLLIDPIVKIEFMRNAYIATDLNKKENFLKFNKFYGITDHQEIFRKTMENSHNISRIYAHNGNPRIPLGDLLIIARLKNYYDRQLFLTLDKSDFSTILFDRVGVISIEKISKDHHNILEHIVILKFNKKKYEDCFNKLP